MSSNESRSAATLYLPKPYLLFLADVSDIAYAKTALGLRDWAPELCVGEWRLPSATVTTGLPQMKPNVAYDSGARAMVIGIANVGGQIPATWIPCLVEALEAGLDLVAGMHTQLNDMRLLRNVAHTLGRKLFDVRVPPPNLPVATGVKRSGKRLLTVGTDCALGKKYMALSLTRELRARGVKVDYRATGQTGILIAGRGIPLDAVVSDFAAGAAEQLTPNADHDHWDVIEGQGSLFHPAYAGVSLALLHGSQPDVIVVCHEPRRAHMQGFPGYVIPNIEETIALNLQLGRRTNPAIRCGGVGINTVGLNDAQSLSVLTEMSARLGLPVADPMRPGPMLDALVAGCMEEITRPIASPSARVAG